MLQKVFTSTFSVLFFFNLLCAQKNCSPGASSQKLKKRQEIKTQVLKRSMLKQCSDKTCSDEELSVVLAQSSLPHFSLRLFFNLYHISAFNIFEKSHHFLALRERSPPQIFLFC